MMRFDLVFALVDITDNPNAEWYRTAAKLMIASARRAYRAHDMRVVQITDEASAAVDDIDLRFNVAAKVEREELMQYRGHCLAEWALETDRPVIFCDVDLLWNTDALMGCLQPQHFVPQFVFDGQRLPGGEDTLETRAPPGIVLTQRPNLLQPYNGGLILTQPGQKRFWETYRGMMKSLPEDLRGWWGDQLALAVMLGAPENGKTAQVRFGSTIACLPADLVAPSPKSMPVQVLDNPAVHWKGGKRKPMMPDYYAMLEARWAEDDAAESHIAVRA